MRIGIIIGSTRPGRNADVVARWVHSHAVQRTDATFVGGTRAVEHLRLVMGELQVADVRAQVALSLFTDWRNFTEFAPGPQHASLLSTMLDQVVAWSHALAPLRNT